MFAYLPYIHPLTTMQHRYSLELKVKLCSAEVSIVNMGAALRNAFLRRILIKIVFTFFWASLDERFTV